MFFAEISEDINSEISKLPNNSTFQVALQTYNSDLSIENLIEPLKYFADLTDQLVNLSPALQEFVYNSFHEEIKRYPVDARYNLAINLANKFNFKNTIDRLQSDANSLIEKVGVSYLTSTPTLLSMFFNKRKDVFSLTSFALLYASFFQLGRMVIEKYSPKSELTNYIFQVLLISISAGYGYYLNERNNQHAKEHQRYQLIFSERTALVKKLQYAEEQIALLSTLETNNQI